MADLGKLWTPVVKGGHFPATYFRTGQVARSSKRVEAVNKKLAEAANKCEGKHTSDGSFQECVRKEMEGYEAPGEDAPSYKKAQEYAGIA